MEKTITMGKKEYDELVEKLNNLEQIAADKPVIALIPSWPRFGRMKFINPDEEMSNLAVSLNRLAEVSNSQKDTIYELSNKLGQERSKNLFISNHWLLKHFLK